LNASNDVVKKTLGKLSSSTTTPFQITHSNSQLDLTLNSPFPSDLVSNDDDADLYFIMRDLYNNLLEPLTGKRPEQSAKMVLSVTPTPSDPSDSTTFTFNIVFGCSNSNPHWNSVDVLQRQWTTFSTNFHQIEIIQLLFKGPTQSVSAPIDPTPETLPGDGDEAPSFPEKPSSPEKPNGVLGFSFTSTLLMIFVSFIMINMMF
jgi:hypothetical protein